MKMHRTTLNTDFGDRSRREIARQAEASFGIWKDRDPDAFLDESRNGLKERDNGPWRRRR